MVILTWYAILEMLNTEVAGGGLMENQDCWLSIAYGTTDIVFFRSLVVILHVTPHLTGSMDNNHAFEGHPYILSDTHIE